MKKKCFLFIALLLLTPCTITYANSIYSDSENVIPYDPDNTSSESEEQITGEDIIERYEDLQKLPNSEFFLNADEIVETDEDSLNNWTFSPELKKIVKGILLTVLITIAFLILLIFHSLSSKIELERNSWSVESRNYVTILELVSGISFFSLIAVIIDFINSI